MNWSLYTADRSTHLKIVVVALVAATIIAGFGIALRGLDLGTDILTAQNPTVVQPDNLKVWTSRDGTLIR
ncbi:MAG TPA: hypothetical protein VFS63_15475 [Pseudolabrys sp.]|jgi:hypothetical protein|nr:hypothetical protein [Pseudolabrys sp.]